MAEDHIRAHKHSDRHRSEIFASETCGCFYCLQVYPPSEISTWIDKGRTALCPRCGIDSVIGSASGFPINRTFLFLMHEYWF